MSLATANDFLARCEHRYTEADVPGIGRVRLRNFTAGELAKYEQLEPSEQVLYVLRTCPVDANGKQLFNELDAEKLADIDSAVIMPLFIKAVGHIQGSMLSMEDAEKN